MEGEWYVNEESSKVWRQKVQEVSVEQSKGTEVVKVSKVEGKDLRDAKSRMLANEETTFEQDIMETKQEIKGREDGGSKSKGVKRKPLDMFDRYDASTRDSHGDEVEGSGSRLQKSSQVSRNGEKDGSRSQKRHKIESLITRIDESGSAEGETEQNKKANELYKVPKPEHRKSTGAEDVKKLKLKAIPDDVNQKHKKQERVKGKANEELHSDLERATVAEIRRERDGENKANGQHFKHCHELKTGRFAQKAKSEVPQSTKMAGAIGNTIFTGHSRHGGNQELKLVDVSKHHRGHESRTAEASKHGRNHESKIVADTKHNRDHESKVLDDSKHGKNHESRLVHGSRNGRDLESKIVDVSKHDRNHEVKLVDDSKHGRGQESKTVDNSKKRRNQLSVRKETLEKVEAHDATHVDKDHNASREDRGTLRGREKRFRAGEVQGETVKEGNKTKETFRGEEKRYGACRLQPKDVNHSQELANGNKSKRHGEDVVAEHRGCRHLRFSHLAASRTLSRNKRLFKADADYKGHLFAYFHRQLSRGGSYCHGKLQRRNDQGSHREAHRTARGAELHTNFVRDHRRGAEGVKKDRFVEKSRGMDESSVVLSKIPVDQKKLDNSDIVVSRGRDQPGGVDIEGSRHDVALQVSKSGGSEGGSTRRCSSKVVALVHGQQNVKGCNYHRSKVVNEEKHEKGFQGDVRMDLQNHNDSVKEESCGHANCITEEEAVGSSLVASKKALDAGHGVGKLKKAEPDKIDTKQVHSDIIRSSVEKSGAKISDGTGRLRAESGQSQRRSSRKLKNGTDEKSKDDPKGGSGVKKLPLDFKGEVQERRKTEAVPLRKSVEAHQTKVENIRRAESKKLKPISSRRPNLKREKATNDCGSNTPHHERHRKKQEGRCRSISRSPQRQRVSPKEHGNSISPRRLENDRAEWEKFERERNTSLATFDSRYRRFGGGTSGLGGYSPRRRRSEAAIKTPSPPPRSPERRKPRAWDLPPVGLDSSMVAALSAAHQAVQQAVVHLAAVTPLIPPSVLVTSPVTGSSGLGTVPNMIPSLLQQVNPAVTAVSLTQATRPFRRLYVGNVPATVSDGELLEFMNAAMLSANANHLQGTKPCINCTVNVEKSYAFAEFITPEDATAALAFDGVTLHGTILKIRRPKDYVSSANGGAESTSPVLNMVSSTVADSPHKVFVGGISTWLTADKVKEIVTAFGQLKAYHWEVDYHKHPPQASAFLEYLDPGVTLQACAGLNGMRLGSGILTVVQATPDADLETSLQHDPFYGIPQHARPLLEAPTRVLELSNLVAKDDLRKMSKEETDEFMEDIRLECKRFGNVKSTHMVQPWEPPQLDPSLCKSETAAVTTVEGDCCITGEQELLHTHTGIMKISNEEPPQDVQAAVSDETPSEPLGGHDASCSNANHEHMPMVHHPEGIKKQRDFGTGIENPGDAGELNNELQSSLATQIENPGDSREFNNEQPSKVVTGIENPGDSRDLKNEQLSNLITGNVVTILPSHGHELGDILKQENDLDPGLTRGSTKGLVDSTKEWEILHAGRVYVEFSREESTCLALHSLHGRMFAGRKVVAGYFPLKLYQKNFGKGLGPRTHAEKQALALAVQGHLTEHIKD